MRIDAFLTERGFFVSRNKAKESVERGEIIFNGMVVEKPSFTVSVSDSDKIKVVKKVSEFVSIGGFKLEKALDDFNFSVKGLVCADVGASTGGFTDCLIQRGAEKVYAIDLNDNLLSNKLKENSAVIPIIKNARLLDKSDFPEQLDLITADLSFISETLVIPVFSNLLSDLKHALILIKPQFENDKKVKFKNGIISDENVILSAIKKVALCASDNGFSIEDVTCAPKKSGKNREYLILLKKGAKNFDLEDFYGKIKL